MDNLLSRKTIYSSIDLIQNNYPFPGYILIRPECCDENDDVEFANFPFYNVKNIDFFFNQFF